MSTYTRFTRIATEVDGRETRSALWRLSSRRTCDEKHSKTKIARQVFRVYSANHYTCSPLGISTLGNPGKFRPSSSRNRNAEGNTIERSRSDPLGGPGERRKERGGNVSFDQSKARRHSRRFVGNKSIRVPGVRGLSVFGYSHSIRSKRR